MKVFLCQTQINSFFIPVVPHAQCTLAAHISDVAEVQISGFTEDGFYPSIDETIKRIIEFQPDVVGITIQFAASNSSGIELAKRVKEYNPEITVIAGGHHATFTAEGLLSTHYFDAIFYGEGEVSLRDYVIKKDFRDVKGVIYLCGNEVVNTGPAPLMDLNDLKPPAYHLLKTSFNIMYGIESSRGCPYKCDFCETRNFFGGVKTRKMSPDHFIENAKKLVEDVGGCFALISDDCFTADMKGHAKPICEKLVEAKLPIMFMIQARMDNLLDNLEMIPLIAKAGVKILLLGIESIYQQTRDLMNKDSKVSNKQIENLINTLHKNGIAVMGSIVTGYPNETAEMIYETVNQLIRWELDIIHMFIATPYPGSQLQKRLAENGDILHTNYDLFNGLNRIVKTIPESTMEAVANARRNFYLRPDNIKRRLEDASNRNITEIAPAAMLSRGLLSPELACPRNAGEWVKMLQGLNLYLCENIPKKNLNCAYTAVIKFMIDSAVVFLHVMDGLPVDVCMEGSAYDLCIETDQNVFVNLWVLARYDILSMFMLGKVNARNASLDTLSEFVIWFTEIQSLLRWGLIFEFKLPAVRSIADDWFKQDKNRLLKFQKLFDDESTMFIGTNNGTGLWIEFSNQLTFGEILLNKKNNYEAQYDLEVKETTLKEILSGGYHILFDLLDNLQLVMKQVQKKEDIKPKEFFRKVMPSKFLHEKSQNINITIQFNIGFEPDSPEDIWWATIRNNKLFVGNGMPPEAAAAVISTEKESYNRMINRKVSPMQLYNERKSVLKGDMQKMMQFVSCFEDLYSK